MAEILVKATNATNPDPVKDAEGCYKRGMPVEVFPDGAFAIEAANPASNMLLPRFVWLLLPGVSVDKVRQFIEPDEDNDGFEDDGVTPRKRRIRRRLWRLVVDDMPQAARSKFASSGHVVIGGPAAERDYTWSQVKTYLRNLRDNSEAPDI